MKKSELKKVIKSLIQESYKESGGQMHPVLKFLWKYDEDFDGVLLENFEDIEENEKFYKVSGEEVTHKDGINVAAVLEKKGINAKWINGAVRIAKEDINS